MDGRGLDDVVVVKDEHGVSRESAQSIHHRAEETLHWNSEARRGAGQEGQGRLRNTGLKRVQGRQDVRPETARVVVLRIQGHPAQQRLTAIGCLSPGGQEGRLSETGGSCDKHQFSG